MSDVADCGQSRSTRSSTEGSKSFVTAEINGNGPVQPLDDDDESLASAEAHRRTSEPVDPADSGLVTRRCSDQQQRRGPSNPEEAGSNSVMPPEASLQGLSTSLAARDRKLFPDIGTFWKWTAASLDDEQIQRIELFYASHATQISVCRCLACLYFTSASAGMSWTHNNI